MVAGLRQQGDPPALRGDRAGRLDLRRQRWRGLDLPGVARRQGDDPLRCAPGGDPDACSGPADGALYAGTAAEAGGGSSARSSLFLTQEGGPPPFLRRARLRSRPGRPARAATTKCRSAGRPGPGRRPWPGPAAGPAPPGGGSAAPRPIPPGDNAVYRLDADGVPREVLRVKALVHALAWADDRLLVGTGPEGQLYEVRDRGHETAPIAKLDNGQILSLLAEPDGAILVGTGDPGSVVRLARGIRGGRHARSRRFTTPSSSAGSAR